MTQPGTPIQAPERDGEAPAPKRELRARRVYTAMEEKGRCHLPLREVAGEAKVSEAILRLQVVGKENEIPPTARWIGPQSRLSPPSPYRGSRRLSSV